MQVINKIKNLNFGVVTLVLSLFLLVNTTIVFGTNADSWEKIIMIYITMTAFLFALPDLRSKLFQLNFWTNLPKFLLALIIGYIVAAALLMKTNIPLTEGINLGVILVQSFIIAISEESLFREFLGKHTGTIIASAIFAIFHYTVYNGNIIKFIVAFAFSMILFIIKNFIGGKNDYTGTGLLTIIGIHAGWNIAQYTP